MQFKKFIPQCYAMLLILLYRNEFRKFLGSFLKKFQFKYIFKAQILACTNDIKIRSTPNFDALTSLLLFCESIKQCICEY